MKKLFVILTCAASFAACRSSNGPGFDQAAVMPKAGSEFIYQVVAPQGQLQEITTITNLSNNSFTAIRKSGYVNGFSTSDSEQYSLLASSDLLPLFISTCDSFPLPIATHRSFISPNTSGTPTKLNGFVDSNSSVIFQTQYEGEVTINAAGTNFPCSQVSETITVMAVNPLSVGGSVDTQSITHRYWYSSAIGFFVKDQETEQTWSGTKTDYTRTLVSYK
jgi:hypothetical protein